jgi:hypothetical protein
VFLVASAVIAFRGWPGAGFADRIGNLFVKDQPTVPWDRSGTAAVAAAAGAGGGAVAATPAGPTFGTPGLVLRAGGGPVAGGVRLPNGAVISTGSSGPGTVGSVTPGTPGGGTLPSVPPGGGSGTGPVQRAVANTVQSTGRSVGQTVRRTTGSAGGAVGGPAGGAVTQTGSSVGGTVEGVGNGVADTLRPHP